MWGFQLLQTALAAAIAWLLLLQASCKTNEKTELKFVLLFHRHGARAPIKHTVDFPGWNNWEQLTSVGMRQLYLLGTELRKRYIVEKQFLPQNYSSDYYYVRSTFVNRTIMSAASLLSGLYPEGSGPKLPDSYPSERAVPPFQTKFESEIIGKEALPRDFQTIPIHSEEITSDFTFLAERDDTCPALEAKRVKLHPMEDGQRIMKAFAPMVSEISRIFGIPKEQLDITTTSNICDSMLMTFMDNRELPFDSKGELFQQMLAFINVTAIFKPYPAWDMAATTSTKMIDEFITKFDGSITGSSTLKFAHYSAHDSTLNALLASLNVTGWECLLENYKQSKMNEFDYKCPYTARVSSNIIIELHKTTKGKHIVKFFYDDKQYHLLGEKELDYNSFKTLLRSVQVPDFEDQCLGPRVFSPIFVQLPLWQWIALGLQLTFVFVLAFVYICHCIKARKTSQQASQEKPFLILEP